MKHDFMDVFSSINLIKSPNRARKLFSLRDQRERLNEKKFDGLF